MLSGFLILCRIRSLVALFFGTIFGFVIEAHGFAHVLVSGGVSFVLRVVRARVVVLSGFCVAVEGTYVVKIRAFVELVMDRVRWTVFVDVIGDRSR